MTISFSKSTEAEKVFQRNIFQEFSSMKMSSDICDRYLFLFYTSLLLFDSSRLFVRHPSSHDACNGWQDWHSYQPIFYMFTIVFHFHCVNSFSRWLHSGCPWSLLTLCRLITQVSQILSSPMDWTRVYFLHRTQETRSSRWCCAPKKRYLKKTTVSREVIIIYLF